MSGAAHIPANDDTDLVADAARRIALAHELGPWAAAIETLAWSEGNSTAFMLEVLGRIGEKHGKALLPWWKG